MNIFFLDRDIQKCVESHNSRHCVKMILEYSQLLCSALHMTGKPAPYKLTHKNHPCAVWARQSICHWNYLKELALALCKEYTYRYGKVHKSQAIIESLETPSLPDNGWSDPPQCMPEESKRSDVVEAYRAYYITSKSAIAQWKNRKAPEWYK